MQTKAIDICLPPAKTELEDWERWMNRMQSEFATAPWVKRKIIEVKYDD